MSSGEMSRPANYKRSSAEPPCAATRDADSTAVEHPGAPAYVVFDRNPKRIAIGKDRGVPVVYGDAASPSLISAAGVEEPTALQCVGGHIESERMALSDVPAEVASRRRSRLVFIGRTKGIERERARSARVLRL